MRKSGILLPLFSLPSPFGLGTLGKEAYHFADFLSEAGQSYWQILPLAPTGYGASPYQALSSFAGNPFFIDPELLQEKGLLKKEETELFSFGGEKGKIEYNKLSEGRLHLLALAYDRFTPDAAYESFVKREGYWLEDFALFAALKDSYGGGRMSWREDIRRRAPAALDEVRVLYAHRIAFHKFLQFLFFEQFDALRAYLKQKGIGLIGDLPIYPPSDSADVWVRPELFELDENLAPSALAGCPPDAFTPEGQLWGNPVYSWESHKKEGYKWWLERLRGAAKMYDVIRLDHFRGLESFWSVPAGSKSAAAGGWRPGPGADFIDCIKRELPETAFIAEDLGYVTPEVEALRARFGHPGMKVLQFSFDTREPDGEKPHDYPKNSVCYTGTHDNTTLAGWCAEADPADVAAGVEYFGLNATEGFTAGLLRGGAATQSELFIAGMADFLELGEAARINTPGLLSDDNWSWRLPPDYDKEGLAEKIRAFTKRYGRYNKGI